VQSLEGLWNQVQTLADRVQSHDQTIDKRLSALEGQKLPQAPDLQPLNDRIAALEKQVQGLATAGAAGAAAGGGEVAALQKRVNDLAQTLSAVQDRQGKLGGQLDQLAQAQSASRDEAGRAAQAATQAQSAMRDQLGQVTRQLDQLAQAEAAQRDSTARTAQRIDTVAQAQATLQDSQNKLAQRIDALAQRQDTLQVQSQRLDELARKEEADVGQLAQKQQDALAQLDRRTAGLETQIGELQRGAGQVTNLIQQTAKATRLQEAAVALEAGRPLGRLPDAPPALARFATEAPPTLAQLRLSYPEAAQAAERAAQPETGGGDQSFADRWWARAQQALTVKQGDQVLVGNPVSGILASAQQSLEAGDLAAAVNRLSALKGASAQAMAPWMDKARALLDAQAALAQMAGRA
jgi:hypothetical protein